MKTVFLGILGSLFIGILAPALEIKDELAIPPGEFEHRGVPFILSKAGEKISLPIHSSYLGRVFNQSHTMAAINYHETSDYDGVDLVIANADKIYILQDILTLLQPTLQQKGMLAVQPWGRIQLTAKSIVGNKVHCVFRGIISKTDALVERPFNIMVGPANPMNLQILKE